MLELFISVQNNSSDQHLPVQSAFAEAYPEVVMGCSSMGKVCMLEIIAMPTYVMYNTDQ